MQCVKGAIRLENKKNGKKILIFGLVGVLLIGIVAFVAFSSGGRNGNLSEKKIIGRWQCDWDDNETSILEFNKVGTVYLHERFEDEIGQWTITDGNLVVISGMYSQPFSLKYADGQLTFVGDGRVSYWYKVS